MLRHDILKTAPTMIVATNIHIEILAASIPLRFEMRMRTETTFLCLSTMITSARIRVPRGRLPAVSIVFGKIHLCTAWCGTTRIAITTDATIWTAEVSEVEVVVHVPVSFRQIHVPLNVSASQIKRSLGTDATLSEDGPSARGPLNATLGTLLKLNLEVSAGVWAEGLHRPRRGWRRRWWRRRT